MNRLHRLATTSLGALALTLATACNTDGDGAFPVAAITISMTSSVNADLSSFRVEVQDLRLRRSNGALTSVLATPVMVDLGSLAEFSQVLSAATVPSGSYDGVVVTLDFATAIAVIQGNPGPAALLDSDGAPLTGTLDVPLLLSGAGLNAAADTHTQFEVNFALDQSAVVDAISNFVSLEPVLGLRAAPAGSKPLIALGTVLSVDMAASTFTARIEAPDGALLSRAVFVVGAATGYQIDGVPSVGAAGLTALDALGVGASFRAIAMLDSAFTQTGMPHYGTLFTEAGTGTFNGGSDIVLGYVTDRSSGIGTSAVLTLKGDSEDSMHTMFQHNTTFTVNTSFANTKVVQLSSVASLTLDDVNIGQLVAVFGALSGTTIDATAATDVIRVLPTCVSGTATGAPTGTTLIMTLSQVGPYPETDFLWTNSGASPPDPANFTVDTDGLDAGLGLMTGTPVSSCGTFAPVDDPNQDQLALALFNLEDAPSVMLVRDIPSVGHMVTLTPSGPNVLVIVTGMIAAGEIAQVDQGFMGTMMLPSSPTPQIRPAAVGPFSYSLCDKLLGTTDVYANFQQFSNAVGLAIAQGATVRQVVGVGPYDAVNNIIEAATGSVCIE